MALLNSANQPLESRLCDTAASRHLFTSDDLILVAASGGPDSTALLHALHALGYKVHAANLNHGLRDEAAGDALFVEAFCRERGIPVALGRVDVEAERLAVGGSVQEVARRLRYEFLERTADEVGASVIATAHTKDDQVETVLLNILRGTGPDGLRGIPYRRGRIVRPMLDISRTEVEAYCAEMRLAPRHDSSNDSTKYARNEVRHKLIPYLEERFNSNARDAIMRLSEIAADESDFVRAQAGDWLQKSETVDVVAFAKLPTALQRRVVQLCLEKNGCAETSISFALIERIRLNIHEAGSEMLPGGELIANSDGKRLWIERREPLPRYIRGLHALAPDPIELPLDVPGEAEIPGWAVTASGTVPAGIACILRTWRYGDRITLAVGTKKLQDLFTDAKVPRVRRYAWPILADAETGEVLGVANLRTSLRTPDLGFTAERID